MPLRTLNTAIDIQANAPINLQSINTDVEGSPEMAMFNREMELKGLSMSDSIFISNEKNEINFELSKRTNPAGYNVRTNSDEREYNIAMVILGSEINKLMHLMIDPSDSMDGTSYDRMKDFEKKVLNVYVPLCKLYDTDRRYQIVQFIISTLSRLVHDSNFNTESPQLIVHEFVNFIKFHRRTIINKIICP